MWTAHPKFVIEGSRPRTLNADQIPSRSESASGAAREPEDDGVGAAVPSFSRI